MIPLATVDQAVLNRIAYLSNEPELRTIVAKGRDVAAEIEGLTADLGGQGKRPVRSGWPHC